jgi:hypothetical protein
MRFADVAKKVAWHHKVTPLNIFLPMCQKAKRVIAYCASEECNVRSEHRPNIAKPKYEEDLHPFWYTKR